jgi:hypothetical protein
MIGASVIYSASWKPRLPTCLTLYDVRSSHLNPMRRAKLYGGRPPIAARVVMAGILYRLKTGRQRQAVPSDFGSGSTCHQRFQK